MSADFYTRRAPGTPSSVSDKSRTIEVVWSTGQGVQRRDFDGPFIERLEVSPEAIDMRALNAGAPLLDNHDRSSVRSILGVVESAWLEGGEACARVRFAESADTIFREVKAGVIKAISAGYRVNEWVETIDPRTQQRVLTASKWEPLELSVVAIGADSNAHVRKEESTMSDNENPAAAAPATPSENQRDHQPAPATSQRAQVDARIKSLVELAGLERDVADDLIARGLDLEAAREEVFATRAQAQQPIQSAATPRAVMGESFDDPATRAAHMGEALYCRLDPAHKPSEPARAYMHRSMAELATECLRSRSIPTTGMSSAGIVTRAMHATSDFPLLLGDAVGRTLRSAYQAAPAGVKQIARQTTAKDFRAKHRIQLGEAPSLQKVGEGGEFTRGTMAEAAETYRLESFGRIISLSRQAVINDDLGAFSDLARRIGVAAAEFEAKFLVDLLVSNP